MTKRVGAISLFKKGIKPLRENSRNKNGGELFVAKINKERSLYKDYWNKLVQIGRAHV